MPVRKVLGMNGLRELADNWQEDAARLRRYGDVRGAEVVETLAAQLLTALEDVGEELLDLTGAAEVSGYSKRRLRELVNDGELTNHGRKGRPRFRRSELPRKPRTPGGTGYDPTEDARGLVDRI